MAISKDLIKKNKERLQAEKKHLEQLLERVAKPSEEIEGDYEAKYEDIGDDQDENATEVTQYETNIAEEKNLEDKLKRVNTALLRIEKGTYGICITGGEEISERRLETVPEAENCIDHEDQKS